VEDRTPGEVVPAVFICLGMAGGAAYGWLVGGTIWALVGGAVIVGIAALLVATLVAIAVDALARFLGRRGDR
jgi:hypothetical protein